MPAAATPAAAITATTIVRFKVRCRSSAFRLASALSMSGGAPVDFESRSFFPNFVWNEPRFSLATTSRSLQIVHILGDGECPCAPRAIASCIKPLGARQGRRKIRLCPSLGPFDRGWRWLAIDLCADRLWPNGPAFGLPADCRTASSNCAILALQGPACAAEMPKPKAAMQKAAAIRRFINRSQRRGCRG